MERFAPNTAALDTPIVEGEAIAFESVVCMTRPETESAAPAMSAASTRGTRIERRMRTLAAEPFPKRAATPSEKLMRDAPTKRQTSAIISTASVTAFLFSALSILLILALCRVKAFSPNVVVLAGIAVGAIWTAATTLLQFYATDVGLSAAVVWNFGDLGRATYKTDLLMLCAAAPGLAVFSALAWRYNALLSGDAAAGSMGVNVSRLRFFSLLLASLMTAACVSSLGIIGFVGIICPHVAKRLLGQDHRVSIPASALLGSLLLLCADALSRSLGSGSALPVGAITSLLGAPFFLTIIFSRKEHGQC